MDASETHFSNGHLAVVTQKVRTPARPEPRSWTVVHRKAAVVIAALTPQGKLLLIRQERIPIQAQIWEVPAGQIDADGPQTTAAIAEVARRELREETGYELGDAGELLPLGHFFSSPGFTDEHSYFFLARGVTPAATGSAHDESEAILDCQAFAPAEIARLIAANEICDANTLSVCTKLVALGFLNLHDQK